MVMRLALWVLSWQCRQRQGYTEELETRERLKTSKVDLKELFGVAKDEELHMVTKELDSNLSSDPLWWRSGRSCGLRKESGLNRYCWRGGDSVGSGAAEKVCGLERTRVGCNHG